jgi:hypothetical protein
MMFAKGEKTLQGRQRKTTIDLITTLSRKASDTRLVVGRFSFHVE